MRRGAASSGPGTTEARPDEPRARAGIWWLGAAAAALGLSTLGLVFWLLPYSIRGLRVPVGFDAPWYAWRADVIGELGPGPAGTNARPGHGLLAAILGSATGRPQLELALLLPLVLAVVFALAAGALARAGLGWGSGPWALGIAMAMAVLGASRLLGENQANLLNLALVVASLALLSGAVGRRRFGWGAVAVLTAAGVVHWLFLALGLVVLVASAAVAAWGNRRSGNGWSLSLHDEPGIVLATAGLSAAATGGALVALGPGALATIETREDPSRYGPRLRTDLARLALPSVAALLGLFRLRPGPLPSTGEPGGRRRRFALRALWSWTVVMALGVALFVVWPKLPAHRFLALLAALSGSLGLAAGLGWFVARAPLRKVPGWAAAALAVALVAIPSALRWYDYPALLTPEMAEQAEAAGHLVETVHDGEPVVFVLDPEGPGGAVAAPFGDRTVRVGLPADRQEDTHFYVGAPEDALAGRRSSEDPADAVTDPYWEDVGGVLDEDPPLVVLQSLAAPQYDDAVALGALVVAPGVAVLRPPPGFGVPAPAAAPPSAYPGLWTALGWCLVMLFLLGLAGSGWSWLAQRGDPGGGVDPVALVAMAPTLGAAGLVLVGLVASEVGARLAGPWGVAAFLGVAAAGWAAGLLRTGASRG